MAKMHKHNKGLWGNQKGLVSITITMIVMIVVTLIVSSFALIVRREQRRSLDRQLSAQAFYAAEAGIQDALAAMTKTPNNQTPLTQPITTCDDSNPNSFSSLTSSLGFSPIVSDNVEYTCVLINPTPAVWKIDGYEPDDGPFVIPMNTELAGDNIRSLSIGWQNKDGTTNFPNSIFPGLTQNNLGGPVLRITILPGFNNGTLNSDQISAGAHTMFLYPEASAAGQTGTISYTGNAGIISSDSRQGAIVSGKCNSANEPYDCNVNITGLDADEYFIHMQPLYKAQDISIIPRDFATDAIPIVGAQAEIDVTGRASDVLRRVKVTVPIEDGLNLRALDGVMPLGGLATSEEICKLWNITDINALNVCSGVTTPLGVPPPPSITGNASVGDCVPGSSTSCVYNPNTGQWTYESGSGGSTSSSPWRWHVNLTNTSNLSPVAGNAPMGEVQNCVWEWGDGDVETYGPYQPGPNGSDPCNTDGGTAYHLYPDLTSTINGSTNSTTGLASTGCREYRGRLTVTFNTSRTPASRNFKAYIPGGGAAAEGGPCYKHHTDVVGVW